MNKTRSIWASLFNIALVFTAIYSLFHHSAGALIAIGVDTTTFLADFKNVYGGIIEQINTAKVFLNLLQKGPMDSPISTIGGRGYTILARTARNWRLGYRPEGTTGVGTAGNTGLAQATVTLTYAYAPEVMTGQAINLSKGAERAFMAAKALELKYDMLDLMAHINVVMVGAERGGQLAQILTGATSATQTLSTVGGLPGALYLIAGMFIDCGAVGGGTNSVTAISISSVDYVLNTITLASSQTTVTGDAVYLAGEAAQTTGTFPYTAEGLISLIAATGARQGLNPATAGQTSWQSLTQDVGGVDISSQLIHEQISICNARSGEDPDLGIFPPAQTNSLTKIATQTLRFETAPNGGVAKKALDLGFRTYSYGGRTIVEDKDCRNDRTFWGAADKLRLFEAIPLSMADDDAGEWTRLIASGSVADAIGGLVRGYHQLGIMQRSAWSMYTNFSVPPAFLTTPMSIA